MNNANEIRPAERLAAALRPTYDVAEVAVALQGCMDSAAHAAAQNVKEELLPRLDKQGETLRLMWKQMKGNGKLPIDD